MLNSQVGISLNNLVAKRIQTIQVTTISPSSSIKLVDSDMLDVVIPNRGGNFQSIHQDVVRHCLGLMARKYSSARGDACRSFIHSLSSWYSVKALLILVTLSAAFFPNFGPCIDP